MFIHTTPMRKHFKIDTSLSIILEKKYSLLSKLSNPLFMKKHLPKFSIVSMLIFVLSLFMFSASAQTVVTFPSSSTWTCPAGVTSIKVECWGGGGAGGGANNVASTFSGGGGGGAYTVNTALTVTPSTVYTITVGTGATGTNFSGTAGGNSIFGSSLVIANGGAGGTTVDGGAGAGGAGGAGGTYAGGAGAAGVSASTSSGAGGGGAGSTGAGGAASGITAGAAGGTDGGIGGAGRGSVAGSGNGNPGATYGGGGGGARANGASFRLGGNGANGFVRITYTPVSLPCTTPTAQPTSLILTPASTSIAGSFTASVSANSYLVVRTPTAVAPTNPTDGITYAIGAGLGGYIESIGASTTFTSTGLTPLTQYWYWVFAYNSVTCTGGPLYLAASPLSGNATTTCSGSSIFTGSYNVPSSCFATLASFITALNAGTVTGAVTVNVAAGYTETAPIGGYSITQTGTATNTITFQKSGVGANPTFTAYTPQSTNSNTDGVFKIIGADYITIDGFTMQENAANTTPDNNNNMTEYGVGLFYASTSNGAQNNTIKNCIISLNKTNASTFGIYSNVRHSATNTNSLTSITNFTGSNSYNRFYGNTISNVNMGITIIGSSNSAYHDVGNDIGGSAAATGNTITGWGENSTYWNYVSVTSERYAIFTNHQISDNIAYNTVVSGNISGSSNTNNIKAIFKDYSSGPPVGTFTSTITNNTVTVTDNFTTTSSLAVYGIMSSGITSLSTATININNNAISNCTVASTASATNLYCIYNSSVVGVLNLNANTINNNTSGTSTGGFEAIDNSANIITTINVNNNQIGNSGNAITMTNALSSPSTFGGFVYLIAMRNCASTCTLNASNNLLQGMNLVSTSNVGYATVAGIQIAQTGFLAAAINITNNNFGTAATSYVNYSAADNGGLLAIYIGGGSASCATTITGNNVTNVVHGVAGTTNSLDYYIFLHPTAQALTQNISNNTFTNINSNTNGGVILLYSGVTMIAGATQTVNNNAIVGSLTKSATSGYVYGLYTGASSASGSTSTITNNNFSNITVTGATSLYGIVNIDGTTTNAPTKSIKNNTINNMTGGTSPIVGISANYLGGANTEIANNTITNNTGQGEVDGIVFGSTANGGTTNINNNTINNLSSTATGGFVSGIYNASPSSENIINTNTISNLSTTSTASFLTGIYMAAGTKQTIHNNSITTLNGNYLVSGLYISAPGTGANLIDSNRVSNLTNTSTANNTNVYGINVAGGSNSIDIITNQFSNFNTASTNTSTNSLSAIVGINNSSSGNASNIRNNTIYNMNATNTGSNNVSVVGVATSSTSAGGTINVNQIFKLTNTNTGASASIVGFNPNGGSWTTANNMISIINDVNTNAMQCLGVYDAGATGTRNYYFNSIHIGGSASSGSSNSAAFQYNSNGRIVSVLNNLLNVVRTGSGNNFAMVNLGASYSGFTANNNVLNSSNPTTLAATAGYSTKTFSSWQSTTGVDMQSNTALTVNFIDPTNGNLHIDPNNLCSVRGLGIVVAGTLVDYDNETRKTGASPNGPDVGADEVSKPLIWAGTTNQNWTTASNWAGGVLPTIYADVVIPNVVNSPIINAADNIQINSITVNTGGLLTNNGTLGLTDYISGTNNIDCQSGKLVLNSPCRKQIISGTAFVNRSIKDLTISNSVDLSATANDTLKIIDNLVFGNVNSKTITTNDNLTLLSTATGTANFGDITNAAANSGNTITGKVNIERYLPAKKSWRFLATPVQIGTSPTVTSAWRESNSALTSTGYGTQITGPLGTPTFDQYTQRGSLKSYNAVSDVWTEVTNTSASLANNAGYMVFVRGDRAVAVGGTTGSTNLRIKGDIRTGSQIFSVLPNKFASFGNPYPSRIDFRTITKNNIVDAFTVWNPNSAGSYNVGAYETYVKTGIHYKRGGVTRNFIESGEAVFIQSNSASAGSITVKETDKGSGSSVVSRAGVTDPTLEISFYAKDVDGSMYLADWVMLNFDNVYSAGIDNNDVRKALNVADNLAIINGVHSLVVERRPKLTTTDTIKLSLTNTRVAPYRFEIDPSVLASTGLEAILKDKFLQTETPISLTDVTNVPFDITADAASRVADRFMIVFKQGAPTNFTTISATRNADKTVTVNWGTEGERNVANYTVEQSNDGTNFTAIATQTATANNGTNPTYSKQDATASKAANWYRVKANNTNGTTKYTAIAMVAAVNETIQMAEAKMSIYPNPVVGGNVNLHLDNQANGNYTVQISNAVGL
jgi:hypothetical protein